jgi:hypothetical protein
MLLDDPIEDAILELIPHERGKKVPDPGASKATA